MVVLGLVRGFDEFTADTAVAYAPPGISVDGGTSQIAPRLVALRDRSQDLERQAYNVDGWRQVAQGQNCLLAPWVGSFCIN